jgi:hypothetical protein
MTNPLRANYSAVSGHNVEAGSWPNAQAGFVTRRGTTADWKSTPSGFVGFERKPVLVTPRR